MSYEYVRSYYGVDRVPGQFVTHDVTGRHGVIRSEGGSNQHYIRVCFQGDKHALYCHPTELTYHGRKAVA